MKINIVKRFIKKTLYAIAPKAATAVFSSRARAHSQRILKEWGILDLNRKLVDSLGPNVQSGPFAGLVLTPMTYTEHLGPYLFGTYEAELHPWIEAASRNTFSQVVDVGAKFGYYAIGIARNQPGVEVVAFDTDWWARKAMHEMARANGTPAVKILGYCTAAWLRDHLRERSLVISDCEGFELELFCGTPIPALGSATMLIEIHDMFAPGVDGAIRSRFAATHDIASVSSSETRVSPIDLDFLTPDEASRALHEIRPKQEWLFLTPKRSP